MEAILSSMNGKTKSPIQSSTPEAKARREAESGNLVFEELPEAREKLSKGWRRSIVVTLEELVMNEDA
ncbi:uncharacterized protein BP5553_04441 [Venustampulla echinocandica]|uniref:Uncharacterized protein n=1 Tax=Venustampulla echinocandica TaxID=2656787 RepID=A0A370TNC0_9HELO|nr:uncharacterized protein BP5553_04441 [Venustampulla echinocandica]RDL37008.1 hypothetical protein BP5553_04441 [Venustampulla echinocandica]